MNILLLTAHDIAEYDDLRMLTDLGANVFSIGAYTDPTQGSAMRPPLDVPSYPDLAQRCVEQREKHAGEPMQTLAFGQIHNIVDWAKADRHKRVIWRTCGQSNPQLENVMGILRKDGLEIIRYSPKEEYAFGKLGVFAGQDAMIRFGKYPSDYGPWLPEGTMQFPERNDWTQREEYGKYLGPYVGNVTQNMAERGVHCGLPFYLAATEGLPARPAGPNSQLLPGGIGALSYDEMREYLRHCRAYIYTGTQPASYTLGLIEAMLSGVPVVSMPPDSWWEPDLFEGPEIVGTTSAQGYTVIYGNSMGAFTANDARGRLRWLLDARDEAEIISAEQRQRALELFDIANVAPQWAAFLGLPVRELVAA
jgi:hypothetical protein